VRSGRILVEIYHHSKKTEWLSVPRRREISQVLWDENDYGGTPNTNQVLVLVETNYGVSGMHSAQRYTHFSQLKTLEGAFGLPCPNHACDADVSVMSDLFSGGQHDD
jgi:hypothetical protein